jgi:hypothetical protein
MSDKKNTDATKSWKTIQTQVQTLSKKAQDAKSPPPKPSRK